MGTGFVVSLILTAAGAAVGMQSGATSNVPPDQAATKPITLVGCVQPDTAKPEQFKLADKTGTTYRLTGAKVKGYVWRNVRILGGLVPSPNLAAQAGAIDQTKAAMMYQGANPPAAGNIEPLDVNVTRVWPLTGSCAPKPDQ